MFVKILNDELNKVIYYTICDKDEMDTTETEKFLRKMNKSEYKEDTQYLLLYLFNFMGNKYGASDKYFTRFENEANAFPPLKHKDLKDDEIYPLVSSKIRLYAYRVSESICILFNGGIKTTKNAQDCPNVSMPFRMANVYAKKIREAISDGTICVNKKSMVLSGTEEKEFYL